MEIKDQLSEWVKGNPIHNTERNECCPDFSCCKPDLKADRETRERFYQAFQEKDHDTIMKMLTMFLGAAFAKAGVDQDVYIAGDETNKQRMN